MTKEFRSFLIFAGCVVLAMLPVLLLRDYTPANELRYVSIAHDALRDGNIFTFTNQGTFYADKPPLYLWICMAAYWLAGIDCAWLIGLFSLIPALIITELIVRMPRPALTGKRAMAVRMMILTSVMYLSMSFTLRMDMLMTLWIVAAIDLMLRISRGEGNLRRQQWLMGVYIFLGVFTKGPMGILLPLAALVLFLTCKRDLRRFGRYWGWRCWLIVVGLCMVWWGLAFAEGGKEYIDNLLFHQTVDRAVNAFHHKRPFWYYLVNMWWCFAPWSLFIIATLIARLFTLRIRRPGAAELMSLLMTGATFLILSCLSGKLAVYLLPCMPFAVLASMTDVSGKGAAWQRLLVAIPAGALVLAGVVLSVAIWTPYAASLHFTTGAAVLVCAGAIGMAVCGTMGIVRLYGRRASFDGGVLFIGSGLLVTLFFVGMALPQFNHLIGLRDVAEKGMELQKKYPTDKIVTYRINRAENTDVFFGRPVISVMESGEFDKEICDGRSVMLITPVKREKEVVDRCGARRLSRVKDTDIYLIPAHVCSTSDGVPATSAADNKTEKTEQ